MLTNRPTSTTCSEFSEELIWTVSDLERFASDPNEEVRYWAIRRLQRFAPEVVSRLSSQLLADKAKRIQARALSVLEDIAEPPSKALRSFVQRHDVAPRLRQCALVLLACSGDEQARAEVSLAEVPLGTWEVWARRDPIMCRNALLSLLESKGQQALCNLIGTWTTVANPSDVPVILSALRCAPDREGESVAESRLEGRARQLLYRAGADDLVFDLKKTDLSQVLKRFYTALKKASQSTPNKLDKAGEKNLTVEIKARNWHAASRHALLLVKKGLETTPDTNTIAWSRAVLEALENRDELELVDAVIAVALVLSVLREQVVSKVATPEKPLDVLLPLWSESSTLIRERLEPLILERWQRLAREVGEVGPSPRKTGGVRELEKATTTLLSYLESDDQVPCVSAAISLATRLEGFPIVRALLEAGDMVDAVIEALTDRPALLREMASEYLGTNREISVPLLMALGDQPFRWAAKLVVDSLDDLLKTSDPDEVWDCLRTLGDASAINTAVSEWRDGEGAISRCAAFLATLKNQYDTLPRPVREEAEMIRERHGGMAERIGKFEDPRALLSDVPLELQLRCKNCGRIYNYEVPTVFLSPRRDELGKRGPGGWDGVTLSRIITCKNCGVEDDYEVTARAYLRLLAEVSSLKTNEPIDEQRVVLGEARLFDGTVVRRPTQGLQHLRELAEADPENGEIWRRLGNFNEKLGRLEDAEEAWRKSVEVDPKEIEAAWSLSKLLWMEQRPGAVDCVFLALEGLPDAKLEDEMHRTIAGSTVSLLQEVAPFVSPPHAIMIAWNAGMVGDKATVTISSVDLRKIRRWDRLLDLLMSESTLSVGFTNELPEEEPTILQEMLDDGPPSSLLTLKTPRNAPCPCGSGRQHKNCCGRGRPNRKKSRRKKSARKKKGRRR